MAESPQRPPRAAELFLPSHVVDALNADAARQAASRSRDLVDDLHVCIASSFPKLVEVANEAGARRMTAAIFLVRADELLREARAALEVAPTLCVLGLRSAYELIVVGRYFLVGPEGEEEFRRRYGASIAADRKAGAQMGFVVADPADFLAHLVVEDPKKPRDVATLAADLDVVDRRESGAEYSMLHCYRIVHRFVSNTGSHANVSSVKRFSRRDGDKLLLEQHPDPIFRDPPVFLVAALLDEFAREVFRALSIDDACVPDAVRRP